ncbi:hypothetical protein CPC08DRAFT_738795 [Agrocybe pediades]|nr:hypothetical protein CPC08DRAFT_738795 [Agrocybe pediades]
MSDEEYLEVFGVQRNSATVKDKRRILPKPVIIKMEVNGHPVRALIDTGSLGDFMSTTLADQLKVKRENIYDPITIQLAMQGSRSKINAGTKVNIKYQNIDSNVSNYDLILGTPWIYQHSVCVGLNPARVVIGSDVPLPLKAGPETKFVVQAIDLANDEIEAAREELHVSETGLPPLRAINHTIPLIDLNKKYPWRPSKCPEALLPQWIEKRGVYVGTGRWKITNAGNTNSGDYAGWKYG